MLLGFIIFFPSTIFTPDSFVNGMTSEFNKKIASGSVFNALLHTIQYPWFLAKATGIIFLLWAFAAIIYNIFKPQKIVLILLAWFIPYALIMSSSSTILIRYAVPGIPILALLMAHMAIELIRHHQVLIWRSLTTVAILHILWICSIHLQTMLKTDPRDLATYWIVKNVPLGKNIAITPSHYGDVFYTVPISYMNYQIWPLMLRYSHNASNYLNLPFNILATNESAWRRKQGIKKPISHNIFWKRVMDSGEWELKARFSNRPDLPILLKFGPLPEDMYYIYQETRIYYRVQ